jgi:hypothetical protein
MQFSRYFSINYTKVISSILKGYNITEERIGYFIINNTSNNNIALDQLAIIFNFKKDEKWL